MCELINVKAREIYFHKHIAVYVFFIFNTDRLTINLKSGKSCLKNIASIVFTCGVADRSICPELSLSKKSGLFLIFFCPLKIWTCLNLLLSTSHIECVCVGLCNLKIPFPYPPQVQLGPNLVSARAI